jgi:hypothetical protein
MIDLSDAPPIAAVVAWPALKLWPAYFVASKPALSASFFTILATSMPDKPPS